MIHGAVFSFYPWNNYHMGSPALSTTTWALMMSLITEPLCIFSNIVLRSWSICPACQTITKAHAAPILFSVTQPVQMSTYTTAADLAGLFETQSPGFPGEQEILLGLG